MYKHDGLAEVNFKIRQTAKLNSIQLSYSSYIVYCLSHRNFASGLPAQINAGINIGLSGMPFSGSDIGGFEWYVDSSPPDLELWSRWTEAGCFSGLMHEQGLVTESAKRSYFVARRWNWICSENSHF